MIATHPIRRNYPESELGILSLMTISGTTHADTDLRTVEGRFFDCPAGLVVAAECLGKTYTTEIGGRKLAITLPSLPDAVEPQRTLPPLVAPRHHYEYPPRPDDAEEVDWGRVTFVRGGIAQSAIINEMHYTFEMNGTEEDVSESCERIEEELSAWWERIEMWLDTYTELNLLRHGLKKPLGLGASYLAYARYDDGTVRPVNWTSTNYVAWPKLFEVPDSSTLQLCLELAGARREIPTEWQYLRDARSWLQTEQMRRAVIDACTAAEIALANQVYELLNNTETRVIQELLARCTGIADVAKLVRSLGGATASRKQIEEQLASVRNRAAHAGQEPSREEATSALKAATDVVENVRPLKSLHGLHSPEV